MPGGQIKKSHAHGGNSSIRQSQIEKPVIEDGDEIYANEYDVSDSDLINGGKSTSRQIQPLISSN
jgi:hypothetical protein